MTKESTAYLSFKATLAHSRIWEASGESTVPNISHANCLKLNTATFNVDLKINRSNVLFGHIYKSKNTGNLHLFFSSLLKQAIT